MFYKILDGAWKHKIGSLINREYDSRIVTNKEFEIIRDTIRD